MTGALLFEVVQRGDVWRLVVDDYQGRTFANWRKWWQDGDTVRPTRQGVTIPLERLSELHAAIGAYLASEAPYGPENGV
jgi:hypothetical protein